METWETEILWYQTCTHTNVLSSVAQWIDHARSLFLKRLHPLLVRYVVRKQTIFIPDFPREEKDLEEKDHRALGIGSRLAVVSWISRIGQTCSAWTENEVHCFSKDGTERVLFARVSALIIWVQEDVSKKMTLSNEVLEALRRLVNPPILQPLPDHLEQIVPPKDCFEHRVTTRPSDMDSFRHVNNVVYFVLFEDARMIALAKGGYGERRDDDDDSGVIPTHFSVDFLAPCFPEKLVVKTWRSDLNDLCVFFFHLVRRKSTGEETILAKGVFANERTKGNRSKL